MSARLGWLASGLAIAFLVFDGAIKFFPIAPVTDSFTQLGYPVGLAPTIGALELAIVALYAVPRSAVLGPPLSHTLFGVYVGTIAWGGLYLRDARVRALLLPIVRR